MMIGPDKRSIRRRQAPSDPVIIAPEAAPCEDMTVMNGSIPLPTLLSHALLAFTIEFDNEAEGQIIHRTTKQGASPGSRQGTVACLTRDVGQLYAVHRQKGRVSAGTREPCPDNDEFGGHGEVGIHCCRTISGGPPAKAAALRVGGSFHRRRPQGSGNLATPVRRHRESWQERFGKDEIDELREALGAVRRPARFRTARLSSDSRVRAVQPGAGLQADSIGAPRRRRG
jgi:hypothetical protein